MAGAPETLTVSVPGIRWDEGPSPEILPLGATRWESQEIRQAWRELMVRSREAIEVAHQMNSDPFGSDIGILGAAAFAKADHARGRLKALVDGVNHRKAMGRRSGLSYCVHCGHEIDPEDDDRHREFPDLDPTELNDHHDPEPDA